MLVVLLKTNGISHCDCCEQEVLQGEPRVETTIQLDEGQLRGDHAAAVCVNCVVTATAAVLRSGHFPHLDRAEDFLLASFT